MTHQSGNRKEAKPTDAKAFPEGDASSDKGFLPEEYMFSGDLNDMYKIIYENKGAPLPISEKEFINTRLIIIQHHPDLNEVSYKNKIISSLNDIRAKLHIPYGLDKKSLQQHFLEELEQDFEIPSLDSRHGPLQSPAVEINSLRRQYAKIALVKEPFLTALFTVGGDHIDEWVQTLDFKGALKKADTIEQAVKPYFSSEFPIVNAGMELITFNIGVTREYIHSLDAREYIHSLDARLKSYLAQEKEELEINDG